LTGVGFGLPCLCAFAWWVARGTELERAKGIALLGASALITIYMLSVDSLLVLVARLHPQTYDFIAFLIDGTLGFQPSAIVAVLMGHLPGGRALIDAAIEQGARHLTLEVRSRNHPARSLYADFGLAPVGLRKGYYGDDDALILWAHEIDSDEYQSRLEGLQ